MESGYDDRLSALGLSDTDKVVEETEPLKQPEKKKSGFLKNIFKSVAGIKTYSDEEMVKMGRCEELYDLVAKYYCPGCGGHKTLYDGPSGGGALNVICGECGRKFWICPGLRAFGVEYLGHG